MLQRLMHVPDHTSILPDHIDPIPIPDTTEEARQLLLLIEMGFYPSCDCFSLEKNSYSGRSQKEGRARSGSR